MFQRGELALDSKFKLEIFGALVMQLTQHGDGVIFPEDSLSIDANKVGSLHILECGLVSGTHLVCGAVFLDISDMRTMTEFIGCKSESVRRVVISHLDSFHDSVGERVEVEGKLMDRGFCHFGRKWFSILRALQVDNIRRN